MRAEDIVEILATIADIGNIPFEPGEGWSFSLGLSDGSEVELEIDSEEGSLLLSAALFAVPGDKRAAVLSRAMELNHLNQGTAGATLGWNPADDFLVLSALVPLTLLDTPGFMSALNAFCNQAMAFRAGLPDRIPRHSEAAAATLPSTASTSRQERSGPITFIRG
jgi:hypothetical protein